MALTFERKPDKGGETNHIGCIGIAAEGAEPTVLLLRTGTDEARCKASGFLTKSVATYSGTKYVSGSEKKGDEKKFEASFGIELSSLTDIKGLDTLAEEKCAKENAWFTLETGKKLEASEKKEPKAKGKKEKAKKETEPKEKAETNGAPAEEGKKKKKKEKGKKKGEKEEEKEKGKKKGKKEKAEAKPEPEPPAEKE